MKAWQISVGLILVLLATLVTSCGELSCGLGLSGSDPTSASASTAAGVTTSSTVGTATSGTTTTGAPTATTASTTTTTLSPMEAYRAEMRAWKTEYGSQLEDSYGTISSMRDPAHPSAKEIQAAQDLDRVLGEMVDALERIDPPLELSATHANYLTSMTEMSEGAHDLAEAMKAGKTIRTVAAMTALVVTWEKGKPARTALESALGFSLSG